MPNHTHRNLNSKPIGLFLIFLMALISINAAWAQPSTTQPPSERVASSPASAGSTPDMKMYEIEVAKLAEQKNSTKLTLATILVTALIGFSTIVYNLRNASKQAQLQAKLKAIDVVVSAAGPNSARERLIVVGKLLGSDLKLETKPEDLNAAGIGAGHDQNRKDLLKMLADYPDRQLEILDLWFVVFGKTSLGDNIKDLRQYILGKP